MSTISAPLIYDTYVDPAFPDSVFYNRRRLVVGIDGAALGSTPWGDGQGTGGLCRSWLMYNLASIPSGSTINSAILSLPVFWNLNQYADQYAYFTRATDIAWDGTTMTYNNAPNGTLDTGNSVLVSFSTGGGFGSINITSLVSDALSTGKISLCIQTQGDVDLFDSDFYIDITSQYYVDTYDGSKNPCTLTVDYTEPAGARRFIVSSFT